MTPLELALRQIKAVRRDTLAFLKDIDDDDWFRQPFEGANHVAWQVGHLTVAEYGLVMGEVLGLRMKDVDWIPADFRELFQRRSAPTADAGLYPTPTELRSLLDRVHTVVLESLSPFPEERLDEPSEYGHPAASTKLDALHFCIHHEGLHAGQIAMLRRALGKPPIR